MEGAERWMKGVKMRWMRERKEEMMIVMVIMDYRIRIYIGTNMRK